MTNELAGEMGFTFKNKDQKRRDEFKFAGKKVTRSPRFFQKNSTVKEDNIAEMFDMGN